MSTPIFETLENIIEQVREGMQVYDADGNLVGKVNRVHIGEVSTEQERRGVGPATAEPQETAAERLMESWAEVFQSDGVPEVLRQRLLRNGFLRLDAQGLFAGDRYVLPDQIASVADWRVALRVTRDKLIKR